MGWISERQKKAVVMLIPHLPVDLSNERSCYTMLVAFVPWRTLDNVLQGHPDSISALAAIRQFSPPPSLEQYIVCIFLCFSSTLKAY